MLLDLIEEYDVVLLNEIWGSKWSSYHSDFIEKARNKGFNVVMLLIVTPQLTILIEHRCPERQNCSF